MSIIQDALKKADKKIPPRTSLSAVYARAGKEEAAETVTVAHIGKMKVRYVAYALTLLILISIFAASHFPASKSRNTKVEPIRVTQSIAQPSEKEISVTKELAVIKSSAPMLPKKPAPQPIEFTLSGIMHLENGPLAIINNMRIAEGDDVNGAKVVSITDDAVLLRRQGSEITLRLK